MSTLIEIAGKCKEKREQLGISREELRKKTKIPVDILQKLEEDHNYIQNEPYARFLLKQIANVLDVTFDYEKTEFKIPEHKSEEKKEEKRSVLKFFKISFLSFLLMTFFVLSAGFETTGQSQKFYEFLNSPHIEKETFVNQLDEENLNNLTSITLKAIGDVWITAYVDSKEMVIHLKKGQQKKIRFNNKIRIETVGNPKDLVILFRNKPVKLSYSRKILHNIFIDSDGIFLNGYNLAEKDES
ncbi:helix-turn-helix domain-containing protein [Persephonella sp.]